jgi:hypothetical protein
MRNRRAILIISAFILTLAALEVATRAFGLTDFPIFEANSEIGYIPAPSQSGKFLNNNYWQFNSKSMGGAEFSPSAAVDILLIGDSVVAGGNPYNEKDRLGPQLQNVMKSPVWPISAGSWGLRNELKYLKLHPEVIQASDRFIFVSNSGDFEEASSWSCEKSHPLVRPLWATLFVIRKYLWDWQNCGEVPSNLLVPKGNWRSELREFFSNHGMRNKPVTFVLYSTMGETEDREKLDALESRYGEILAESAGTDAVVYVISVARDARWKPVYYRDSIHPTVEGTRVLAEIIAQPQLRAQLTK